MSRLKHTVYAEALLQRHADIFRPHLATVAIPLESSITPTSKGCIALMLKESTLTLFCAVPIGIKPLIGKSNSLA